MSPFNNQKSFALPLIRRKNSGIILIAVLWVLVILSVLALSLGRSANIELMLAKHAVGRMNARFSAWSGIVYAMEHIRQDTKDAQTSTYDTLNQCAFRFDSSETKEEMFREQRTESGEFSIQFSSPDNTGVFYGFTDEERYFNINALTAQNVSIFIELLKIFDLDELTAQMIAYSALDWIDANTVVSHQIHGAENEYYSGQNNLIKCKNAPFNFKEELLFVRGMDQDVYDALEKYITVFPREGSLKVNFDTASATILKAFARAFADERTNSSVMDADALAGKMVAFREGDDEEAGTEDDRVITDAAGMALNAKEKVIFAVISVYRTKKSDFIRVNVVGTENRFQVQSRAEAVIDRNDLSIVYWNRD